MLSMWVTLNVAAVRNYGMAISPLLFQSSVPHVKGDKGGTEAPFHTTTYQ